MIDTADLLPRSKHLIKSIRRGIDISNNWASLRTIVEGRTDEVCRDFDTRWLTSICDTYVDHGGPIERRNALLISQFVKLEKIAQTYVHWRLGYPGRMGTPGDMAHRKIDLWDGMTSFDLRVGDAPNSLFGRLAAQLVDTPVLETIFAAIKGRLADNDTIFGNLNVVHRHIFENDYYWILGEEYEDFTSGKNLGPDKLGLPARSY